MSGFRQALPVILKAEGGFVDDPHDRGGATNQGITQRTYDSFRDRADKPRQSVRLMTPEERDTIYHRDYWLAGKCDALPWPISLMHFDAVVNHGPRGAWRIMQRALGVTADGIAGPQTLAAIQRADREKLADRWFRERASYFVAIVEAAPSQVRFLRGWINNRVLDLKDEARRLA